MTIQTIYISMQNQMGAVMLTVQKANTLAMDFYTKLRYTRCFLLVI